MNPRTSRSSGPGARARRAGLLPAVLAGAALLMAACGGSPTTGSGTGSGQLTAPHAAAFAACMRGHGEPDFYFSGPGGSTGPSDTMFGYVIPAGTNPGSPLFQAGMKACQKLLGLARPSGPPPGPSPAELRKLVRAAACMRAHGYPGWPDPTVRNGQLVVPAPPAGIDQNSPQFQAAQKTCQPAPAGATSAG